MHQHQLQAHGAVNLENKDLLNERLFETNAKVRSLEEEEKDLGTVMAAADDPSLDLDVVLQRLKTYADLVKRCDTE